MQYHSGYFSPEFKKETLQSTIFTNVGSRYTKMWGLGPYFFSHSVSTVYWRHSIDELIEKNTEKCLEVPQNRTSWLLYSSKVSMYKWQFHQYGLMELTFKVLADIKI